MAITFTNSGTGYGFGGQGPTALEPADQITVLAWAYPTALVDVAPLAAHRQDSPQRGWALIMSGTAGNLRMFRERATSDSSLITNNTPIVTLNKWYKIAATIDISGTLAAHIYTGDLTTALAEATYGTNSAGSGTITDVAAGTEVAVGCYQGLTNRWRGRIAEIAYFDRLLTLAQMEDWFARPRGMDAAVYVSLGKVAAAASQQPNWGRFGEVSVNVYGTPALADHVPLGRTRRGFTGWAGLQVPASTFRDASWSAIGVGAAAGAIQRVQTDSWSGTGVGLEAEAGTRVREASWSAVGAGVASLAAVRVQPAAWSGLGVGASSWAADRVRSVTWSAVGVGTWSGSATRVRQASVSLTGVLVSAASALIVRGASWSGVGTGNFTGTAGWVQGTSWSATGRGIFAPAAESIASASWSGTGKGVASWAPFVLLPAGSIAANATATLRTAGMRTPHLAHPDPHATLVAQRQAHLAPA